MSDTIIEPTNVVTGQTSSTDSSGKSVRELVQDTVGELSETRSILNDLIKKENYMKALGFGLIACGAVTGGALLLVTYHGIALPVIASSAIITGLMSKVGAHTLVRRKEKFMLNNAKIIINKAVKSVQDQRLVSALTRAQDKLSQLAKSIKGFTNIDLLRTLEDIIRDLNDIGRVATD